MQGHVICYECKKLNEHEIKHVTHDFELEEIVHALKMCRHYFLWRRFVLISNHGKMRYLFDQHKLNTRQAILFALTSEFDLEIKHIKGKET